MGRPRKQTFTSEALAELTRQLLYSPRPKRVEQVERAEALHDQLDPDSAYPLEYLSYRITRYRPQSESDALLPGDVAAADLRLLIDQLSRSAPEPAGDEPVHRPSEIADRAGVSLRTIARWRNLGLRWRWWLPEPDHEPVAGIPDTAWQRFQQTQPQRVHRAAGFSRLDADERTRALELARNMTERDEHASLGRVARELAADTRRSPEAMRQLLLEHERRHPESPLFPRRSGPLTPRQRDLAERAFRRGVPLRRIADRLRRSVPTVHHVIQQRRLHRLDVARLEYVALPGFDDRDTLDEIIAAPLPRRDAKRSARSSTEPTRAVTSDTPRMPPRLDDLPPAVAAVLGQSGPPWSFQRELLTRMHARRARADRIRREANRSTPAARDLDRAERDLAEAKRIESRLIAVNAADALSVVRRHLQSQDLVGSGALLRYTDLALDVVQETIVGFDSSTRRTLDTVIRNRLLQRFAKEPDQPRRAEHRPRPAAWSRKLLESRGIACGLPRDPANTATSSASSSASSSATSSATSSDAASSGVLDA
ncbi:MAG: hypothetical protein ACOC1G_02955 [Phycisphaeraceae bacterium]